VAKVASETAIVATASTAVRVFFIQNLLASVGRRRARMGLAMMSRYPRLKSRPPKSRLR
jgi:hypothetical protein